MRPSRDRRGAESDLARLGREHIVPRPRRPARVAGGAASASSSLFPRRIGWTRARRASALWARWHGRGYRRVTLPAPATRPHAGTTSHFGGPNSAGPGLSVLAVHLYGSGARGVGAGRRRPRRAGARRGARANRANRDPRRGRGRAPRAGGVRGGARGFGGRRCSAGGRAGGRGVRRVRGAAAGAADGAGAGDGRCRAYGGCTSADRRDRSVGRGCFGAGRWVPGRGPWRNWRRRAPRRRPRTRARRSRSRGGRGRRAAGRRRAGWRGSGWCRRERPRIWRRTRRG